MKKRLLGFFMLFLVGSASVMAQQAVSGKVTTPDGSPLPGVSVVVKGTTTGTSTDADGRFTLNVPGSSSVLVLSFIGYVTQEVTVGSQTDLSIQ